jgi:hypothetical protein
MKTRHPVRLRVEALEDRTVPSLSVTFAGGSLTVRGTPTSTTLPLVVRGVAGTSQFQVLDGAANLGTYNVVGSMSLLLTREPAAVQVDLNQATLPGNLTIDLGTGLFNSNPPPQTDVSVADQSGTGTGSIRGSVQINNGNGQETFDIGQYQAAAGNIVRAPITIVGNLGVSAKPSASGGGDQFQLGFGSTVRGNVNLSQVDGVNIGEQNAAIGVGTATTVFGNVTVSTSGVSAANTVMIAANVGGSVTVNDVAATLGFGSFALLPQSVPGMVNSAIGRSLYVTFGAAAGGNQFLINGGAGGTSSTVQGDVTFIDNNAGPAPGPFATPDLVSIGSNGFPGATAVINGSLNIRMGNGFNVVVFDAGGTVNGNFYFTAGNGTNDLGGGALGGVFTGTVLGNVVINVGNGTNNFDAAGGVGGQLSFTGGNGSNVVAYDVPAGFAPLVILTFGSGTNSLTINTANISSLTVNGVAGANNTLVFNVIVTWPTTLNNYP